jgi:hypothetical protein
MKKFNVLVLFILAGFSLSAQSIVDTTAQNKNAILEEFTGIHCTWCPAGHLISNQIEAAHPNDFFAINIHVGGYATPGAGEPDFRTSYGTAIEAQTDLQGYPAGTINRHLFSGMSQGTGTAMSRSNWSSAATTTMGQASYVNIAASTDINLSTRVMTIYVEGYFTGTGAPASMKLNVAVLQNNVAGPQTGASKNPGQVLPNGMYNHMHILRELVTGQWGATIDTTSQGTFFARTYTYTVPNDINGVPMELGNLEVVAFISEGNQEIITGNKSTMNFVTPPGIDVVDLSIKNATIPPALCGTSVTPMAWVKNNSSTINADTFQVSYTLNNGTPVTQAFYTPLNAGDSVFVTFSAANLTGSSNDLGFKVDVDNCTHLIDIQTGNNIDGMPTFYVMPAATIGTTYTEDFESYATFSTRIDSTIIVNPTGEPAFSITKDGVTGLTTDLGAYAASTSSYLVNFYGIDAGKTVEMMFNKIDFSSNTGYGLKFDYAYAQYSSENDRLQINISDDCGATWTTVWDKSGDNLKTTAPVGSGNFFPDATQWASANVDLSAYDGKTGVIVSFKAISDYGNNLYFDNINVYNSTTVGIEAPVANNSVSVYPNPAENQFNINLELADNSNVSYSIINNIGQTVLSADLGNLSAGNQIQKINISELAQGIYMVQVNVNGTITTKKLTVK